MAGTKRGRSVDPSCWILNYGKRVTLRGTSDRRAYEGLIVRFDPGGSDGQAKVSVIHTDGLLRRWRAAEIELISVLSDQPFEPKEVEARTAGRAGRGGTEMGQKLLQDGALEGKTIHIWDEDTMKWDSGQVIELGEHGKFHVSMDEGVVALDLADSVWMVDGQSPADLLKCEADVVVLEDRSIPVVVTQQPSSNKMNVYLQTKYCKEGVAPQVFVTEQAIHIQDSSDSGERSRDVVVMLKSHQQCDTSDVVEAVVDKEAWLRVTFRRRT